MPERRKINNCNPLMTELEKYFQTFRKNIIGINAGIDTPYGYRKLVYADWIASGRLYGPRSEERRVGKQCRYRLWPDD